MKIMIIIIIITGVIIIRRLPPHLPRRAHENEHYGYTNIYIDYKQEYLRSDILSVWLPWSVHGEQCPQAHPIVDRACSDRPPVQRLGPAVRKLSIIILIIREMLSPYHCYYHCLSGSAQFFYFSLLPSISHPKQRSTVRSLETVQLSRFMWMVAWVGLRTD